MILFLEKKKKKSISLREENTTVTTGKAIFLSNLKKSLKSKNLADVAAISYVDLCKGDYISFQSFLFFFV